MLELGKIVSVKTGHVSTDRRRALMGVTAHASSQMGRGRNLRRAVVAYSSTVACLKSCFLRALVFVLYRA